MTSGQPKKSVDDLKRMKGKDPISMLTAYTFPVARCLEEAGIDIILVGDTWGMVEMGFSSTRDVTMDHMCDHVAAVRRGAPNTHVIGDMPYQSDATPDIALQNARRFIAAGADSVKLEGPKYDVIETLVKDGVPVFGHTGLTPQTAANFKAVGKDKEDALRVMEEAKGLADVGCFATILEHIPSSLGKEITRAISIPTVGIGAGPDCDGQVLVITDFMGMGTTWPPFSKQYLQLNRLIIKAVESYIKEVKERIFPECLER